MKKMVCLIVYLNNAHGFKGPAVAIQKSMAQDKNIEVHCIDLLSRLGAHATDRLWKDIAVRDLKSEIQNFITYYVVTKMAWLGFELEYQVVKKRLKAYIEELKPDLIVSTHFTTIGILGRFLNRKKFDIPFYVYNPEVISFHRAYMHRGVTDYIGPTPDGYNAILKYGVKPHKAFESSYPLDNKFKKVFEDRKTERKILGLEDIFTVLLSFGGEGVGSFDILKETIKHNLPIQIIVLCGRNEKAVKTLQDLAKKSRPVRIIPLGFISNMQDYLYCCDISAGKAGMNTTFESIYLRRPFIVTKALINERVNVALIRKYDIGWVPKDANEFVSIVRGAFENPESLEPYKKRMENVTYTFSADKLAQDIIKRFEAKKRLPEITTLFFDLAGTLCDIPIGDIWSQINQSGFRNVLEHIGYVQAADSSQVVSLTDAFVSQKEALRKIAKKTLEEFYLGKQLSDFFRKESPNDEILKDCLKNIDLNSTQTLDEFDELFMKPELDITIPFANAVKVLNKLSKRYSLYLLSNNASQKLVEKIVEKMGIGRFFKKVYISCDIGWRKPHSNFIEPILEELKIDTAHIAMIGDRLNQDIQLAHETGMLSVYISAAVHEDNNGVDLPFDLEIRTLEELVGLLS
ncbi:MAG: HAD-IA family hydrolase [Bacteroidetes bacterium]|nr:HAD-IA family hydrolase [Bacteroidota bacterium]